MIRKHLYLLTRTPKGNATAPPYEGNFAHVVRASSHSEARQLAAAAAIDEPPSIWTDLKLSVCSKIGVATKLGPNEVLVSESNAS